MANSHYPIRSPEELFSYFIFGLLIVLIPTYFVCSKRDRLTCMWFVMCGVLHCFFESYILFSHLARGPHVLQTSTSILADIWKEYAKGDPRYFTGDSFILAIESLTVTILGPLCFATAYTILQNHPTRFILQLITSNMHLYGCALYYLTDQFGGQHFKTWHYYVYNLGFNLPWLIVPLILAANAFGEIWAHMETIGIRIQIDNENVDEGIAQEEQDHEQAIKEKKAAKRASVMVKKMA